MEIGIILGQDDYELQRPLDYKIGARSETFAVLTQLGWVVSAPMTDKRRQNICHFAFSEKVKMAENIQTWWDIETYAFKINVASQSKKELQSQKMIETTTKLTFTKDDREYCKIQLLIKRQIGSFPFVPPSLVGAYYLQPPDARAIFLHIDLFVVGDLQLC